MYLVCIGLFYYFCTQKRVTWKQFKAERSIRHSCQVITSKSGNSSKVLCIRHKRKFSRIKKIFSQLTRWPIAVCKKGGEIVEKKSRNYLEITPECPYLCIRFEREILLRGGKNRFWKILKKVPKSFGDSEKWLTFAPASNKKYGSKR